MNNQKKFRSNKGLCSLKEVTEYLSVSLMTVRRMIDRGDLLAVRVGRRVMVPTKSLDRFVDQQIQSYLRSRKRV